jgi:NAD+ kinase
MARKRHMLVLAHTGRQDALVAASAVCDQLVNAGLTPVVAPEQADAFRSHFTGHVGFLAESEKDDLAWTVAQALAGEYDVEERLALDVVVQRDGTEVYRSFALNEATLEKASRARMIEVALEVDGRPISAFGADGVVMATPTGSTAYSFSAGGPVVWPGVEALLMVPLSAHALFARPLVVGPDSVMAVELLERSAANAVLWCDGRRSVDITPGSRVQVSKSSEPIRLARLHPGPFTDRLVNKFSLPVTGWRGPGE